MLNSKEQFSVNSANLNESYIGQLAEAVQYLDDAPVYTLRISGHISTLDQQNQGLSIERAKKIGRYLLILGLPADRIQIDAENINHDLFDEKQSELNTNNHRISIELTKEPNPTKLISAKQVKE